MTFRAKHPLIDQLIDELIDASRLEAQSRIAAQLSPIRPVVAEARKREVAARKAKKALIDQVKLDFARLEQELKRVAPPMGERSRLKKGKKPHSTENCPYLHIKDCPGCGRSCSCYKRSRKKSGGTA